MSKSENKYHVNPFSGMPSICRAEKGRCPYGGATGTDYHYKTYEEAQIASQKYMEENHGLLPAHEAIDPAIEVEVNKIFEWDVLDPYDPRTKELLAITSSEELLRSVFNRHSALSDNWDNLRAAFQNPNLPREYIDDFVNNPNDYTDDAQRQLAQSPLLTKDDIIKLAENTVDADTMIIAYRHPSLDEEFIRKTIKTNYEIMTSAPYIGLIDNPNLPQDIKDEFHSAILMGDITYPIEREQVERWIE